MNLPAASRAAPMLLLTATVTPLRGLPSLARTDASMRLDDYRRALNAYMLLLNEGVLSGIVFAENSNADISCLKADVAAAGLESTVEFLSFNGLDFDPAKGRGYGEFRMVDYAVEHSNILQRNTSSMVWKCTGRYIIRNLQAILTSTAHADIVCHCRNYPVDWCELYLLAWSRRGHDAVLKDCYRRLANDLNPNMHTTEEILFRQLIDEAPDGVAVTRRLSRLPRVDGVRGWNNKQFDSGWNSPKNLVRRTCIRLLPFVWI